MNIFATNAGSCLYYPSNIFKQGRSILEIYSQISNCVGVSNISILFLPQPQPNTMGGEGGGGEEGEGWENPRHSRGFA